MTPSGAGTGDSESLELLLRSLQLSSHHLEKDPAFLASQLTGRLLSSPQSRIQALLDSIRRSSISRWLRPLMESLESPGGALERTLTGHTKGVGAVAITCDGRLAVSASADLTLRVWEIRQGRLERTLSDAGVEPGGGLTETHRVGAVAVVPNSRLVICAFNDPTPRVWDIASGTVACLLEGHGAAVRDIAATPDGAAVVTASADHTLRVWALHSGPGSRWTASERGVLRGHRDEVRAVAVVPDGLSAVSGADDGTVRLWDLERCTERHVFTGHTNIVSGVAVSPDGRFAASSCADGMLIVWDLTERHSVQTLSSDLLGSPLGQHRSWLSCTAFTPDGRRVLSGARDTTIKLWGLATGDPVPSLRGHTRPVSDIAVTPAGRRAVSASNDHTLKVWNLTREADPLRNRHAYEVSCAAIAPDQKRAATGSHDGAVKIWDLETGRLELDLKAEVDRGLLDQVPAARQVWSLAMLPGDRALSAHLEGSVRVWDLKRGEERIRLRSEAGLISRVAASPNGRRAVTASGGQLTLWELDLYRAEQVATVDTSSAGIRVLLVASDGRTCAGVTEDGKLFRWDIEASRWRRRISRSLRTQRFAGLSGPSVPVALMHDARRAVTGSEASLIIWDLAHQGEPVSLACHPAAVTAVGVSSDGRWVVSGHDDGVLEIRDLSSGQLRAAFAGDSSISAVAVTSDGQTLVAGEVSGRVHILRLSNA